MKDKYYNPTRMSFEITQEKKDILQQVVPSGKLSKVFQNFTEYLLKLCVENPSRVRELAYLANIDYLEMRDKTEDIIRESLLTTVNNLRISVGLSPCKASSLSAIKRAITDVTDTIGNISSKI